MAFWEAVRLALQTIRAQKLKSAFSIIGVFIGVMFLIAVVSVVQGMNRYMTDKFAGTILGVNTFRLRQFPDVQLGNVTDSTWRVWRRRPRVSYEDAQAVMRGVTVPVLAAWESSTRTTLVAGRKQAKDVAVTAATELYFDIRALPVEQGRPFTGQEVQAGVPVLVLGHELADKLFEGQDPIGREVRIFGLPYRVIGVVEKQGNLFGLSLDKFAVAPASAPLKSYVSEPRVVDAVAMKARSQPEMRAALAQAEAIMRSRRHLRPREPNDFALETADEVLDFWGKISRVLFVALPGLVAISLVVGGIVIMNIMLMAVAERTREIGIRKSLGARRRDILRQFLVEATTLATVGAAGGGPPDLRRVALLPGGREGLGRLVGGEPVAADPDDQRDRGGPDRPAAERALRHPPRRELRHRGVRRPAAPVGRRVRAVVAVGGGERRRHLPRSHLHAPRRPGEQRGGRDQPQARGSAVSRERPHRPDEQGRGRAVQRDRGLHAPGEPVQRQRTAVRRDPARRVREVRPLPQGLDAARRRASARIHPAAVDGRGGRDAPLAARAQARPGEQLLHRDAGQAARLLEQGHRDVLPRDARALIHRPDGGRGGRRGDHDDLGDGADARDRRAQGAGRDAARDPVAVPGRGGDAHARRRRGRDARRRPRRVAGVALHSHPRPRPRLVHRGGAHRLGPHGRRVRAVSGESRLAARSGRGAEIRIAGNGEGEKGNVT